MFQFRIRTLFLATMAAACLFGCLFALPNWMGCSLLAAGTLGFMPAILSGVAFTRGNWRAFWMGAASLCWVTIILNLTTILFTTIGIVQTIDSSQMDEAFEFVDESAWIIKGTFLAHAALLIGAGGLSALLRAWSVRSESPVRITVLPPMPVHEVSPAQTKRMMIAWLVLLATITAIFGGTAALMQVESYYGIFVLWPATLMIYPALAVTLWYGRDRQRAFAMGGMSVAVVTLLINMGLVLMFQSLGGDLNGDPGLWFLAMLAVKWVLVFGGGLSGGLAHVLAGGGSGTSTAAVAVAEAPLGESVEEPISHVLEEEMDEVMTPAQAPGWAERRADGPHELTGPSFGGDQPVTPAGDAPEGDDDRPIRRPR
jgi:hypothetical protein